MTMCAVKDKGILERERDCKYCLTTIEMKQYHDLFAIKYYIHTN